jgi:type II secretory pathway pseudopilin PulG
VKSCRGRTGIIHSRGAKFFEGFSLRAAVDDGMNTFMNQSDSFKRSNQNLLKSQNQSRAFTLTELAVVIATIAVLVMVVLPALAGAANKGGRMQCANNLRQIGVASMIYATEYKDVLPLCTIGGVNGGGKSNNLADVHYTYYLATGNPNSFVPTNRTPATSYYQNLGYLYRNSLAGNGSIFFCPEQWGTLFGANDYSSPSFMSTDLTGYVRSSYAFNPRIADATNGIIARRYQKTSDLEPHKLFTVDYFPGPTGSGFSGASVLPSHFRENGWNVLFTDGSVQFSQNVVAYIAIQNFFVQETATSREQEDFILNCLELDH